MEMLRHDHIANDREFIFLPDLFEDVQEQVSAGGGAEKWLSLVTTTSDEMKISASIPST
jgi:hypothetical protein